MTTINTTASANEILNEYRLKTGAQEKSNELGKSAFLELMIAQLNNQSPLEPQDNSAWVAQLAQFSSVESLENLNSTVNNIAGTYRSSQALQASAMVGRDVLVAANSVYRSDMEPIQGLVELEGSTSELKIGIYSSTGELVRELNLGQQRAGDVSFRWDGTNGRGDTLPAGTYSVKAQSRAGGDVVDQSVYLADSVDSVSIDAKGSVTLNLAGRGSVAINDVKEIF